MNVRLVLLGLSCLFLTTHGSNADAPKPPALAHFEIYDGRVEAAQRVELRARVTGYLTKVNFRAGDNVQKGQVLFELDERPYRAALEAAEARMRSAEAQMSLAKAELDRADRLLAAKMISKEDYERTKAIHTDTRSKLIVAAADQGGPRIDLEYTRIHAPFEGKIGEARITVGNLVKGDTTVLAVVDAVELRHVYFDVDERTALQLSKLGADVPVSMGRAADNLPHKGKIDFVDHRVDAKTGMIRCRAAFANADGTLWPGMRVSVRVPSSGPRKMPAPPKIVEPPAKLKELLEERRQVLKQVADQIGQQVQVGRITSEALTQALRAVLEADLELSTTPAARVEVLRAHVKLAENAHKTAEARVKAGVGAPTEALQARALLLEARIRLVREEGGK